MLNSTNCWRKQKTYTPDDDAYVWDADTASRGVWVGTGGDINILAADDTVPVLYPAVADNTLLLVYAAKVLATNTTASDIIVGY